MPQHPSHHTRYAGHTLQENKPNEPLPLVHDESAGKLVLLSLRWVPISGYVVHPPPQQSHCTQRYPVRPVLCFTMGDFDVSHLLIGESVGEQRAVSVSETIFKSIYIVTCRIEQNCERWMGMRASKLTQDESMMILDRRYDLSLEEGRTA